MQKMISLVSYFFLKKKEKKGATYIHNATLNTYIPHLYLTRHFQFGSMMILIHLYAHLMTSLFVQLYGSLHFFILRSNCLPPPPRL